MIAAIGGTGGALAATVGSPGGKAGAVVRAPSAHGDFRGLLRDDFVAREMGGVSPRAVSVLGTAVAAPVGALGLPVAAPPGAAWGAPVLPPADPAQDATATVASGDERELDPFSRHHASLGSPDALFSPQGQLPALVPAGVPSLSLQADAPVARAAASLEDLLPALVRRVAFSGDGRRGTVRLELGAGHLAGSTLLVHADGGRVRVHLDVPPGTDASGWQERIERRLHARGIATDGVEVT